MALGRYLRLSEAEAAALVERGAVWDHQRRRRLHDPHQEATGMLLEVYGPLRRPVAGYKLPPEAVRYEDEHLLVVYKAPGLDVQPTPAGESACLQYGVRGHLAAGGCAHAAVPVNRLDRPARGLVLFAKSRECEARLHEMFRLRRVHKRYLAVIPPLPLAERRFHWLDEWGEAGKRQIADTRAVFCRETPDGLLFLVLPVSGLTHQIRRQFAEHLAPLLGDRRYGSKHPDLPLALLCFHYRFRHPLSGETLRIGYIPPDWPWL